MFTKLNKANFDTATNYRMCQTPGASLFDSRQDKRVFSSPKMPDQLCGPSSLLFSGYWNIFSGERQPVREGKTSFPFTTIEQIVINQQFPNIIKKTDSVEHFLKREY
jgi:hypothetical protein